MPASPRAARRPRLPPTSGRTLSIAMRPASPSCAPRVKVLRVLTQLLHAEPMLSLERVRIDGVSGCADYRGTVTAIACDGERAFTFVWDCSWRAAAEGWLDRHGLPDQARAAREFGWQCFAAWAPDAAFASHRSLHV
jgi:hypothetical protein